MDLIDIEYYQYLIEQKIKGLNGRIQMLLDGNSPYNDNEEDLNNSIQALTNALEML